MQYTLVQAVAHKNFLTISEKKVDFFQKLTGSFEVVSLFWSSLLGMGLYDLCAVCQPLGPCWGFFFFFLI